MSPLTHARAACARDAVALALVAIVAVGCAAPEPTKPAAAPAKAPAAAPARAEPAKPAAPIVPELPPAQAKAQAQKLALEAVDQLQNGDETSAHVTLDQALAYDSTNELARKLRDQIGVDAEKELGTVSFRYTVQRDDSLSKLAQQYLGDRFKFWLLARYNDIPNPSRLAAGQVIRIPGKATPPASARPAPAPASEPATPAARTEPEPPPAATDVASLMQKGAQLQRDGNLEGAFSAYSEAALKAPGNRQAVEQREAVRKLLVARYEREAGQAFQRQNLDLSIDRWTRVLELDPNHQKAKLERDRAMDLKKRLSERFGTK